MISSIAAGSTRLGYRARPRCLTAAARAAVERRIRRFRRRARREKVLEDLDRVLDHFVGSGDTVLPLLRTTIDPALVNHQGPDRVFPQRHMTTGGARSEQLLAPTSSHSPLRQSSPVNAAQKVPGERSVELCSHPPRDRRRCRRRWPRHRLSVLSSSALISGVLNIAEFYTGLPRSRHLWCAPSDERVIGYEIT